MTQTTLQETKESFSQYIPTGDFDVISIKDNGSPFLSVLTLPGRQMEENGTYKKDFGIQEKSWSGGITFTWDEEDDFVRFFTVNDGTGLNSSDTTVVLDSNVGLNANMILIVPSTGEQLKVASVNANGTDIVVVRGFGTTAAANIADNATLMRTSSAFAVGEAGTEDYNIEMTPVSNYIQKFITPITSDDATNFIAENPNLPEKHRHWFLNKVRDHRKDIEFAFMFGQKKLSSDGKTGVTEGLIEYARRSGNVADLSGGVTAIGFENAIRDVFRKGDTSMRYAFAGTRARATLGNLFSTRIRQMNSVDFVSLRFTELELSTGEVIRFMTHALMDDRSGYAGYVVLFDPTQLKMVYPVGNLPSGEAVNGKTQNHYRADVSHHSSQRWDIVSYYGLQTANAGTAALVRVV